MANNFCSNCGSELAPGVNFCRNCGTKTAVAATAPTIVETKTTKQPPAHAATTKLAVPANYKKGLLSMKGCTLVFTDSELIVAITEKSLMNDHMASIRNDVKGQGFMKRTAAVMKAGYSFSDRYYSMAPDTIKSESPNNFTIGYSTVQSARYKRGTTSYGYDDTTTNSTPPSLTIKTTGGKLVFTFTTGFMSKQLLSLLNSTFAGRYKGPKR